MNFESGYSTCVYPADYGIVLEVVLGPESISRKVRFQTPSCDSVSCCQHACEVILINVLKTFTLLTQFLCVWWVRLDDLIQSVTEDHELAEHETPPKPQDKNIRVAPPDFKTLSHPSDYVKPKNSRYQRDKTNLWPHSKENSMSDVKTSGKWRDIAEWQWEREEDKDQRWGLKGGGERRWNRRNWERGRGSGYWQRERRGRRPEYTSRERLQVQPGVLRRIDSSNTTAEEWTTPLPRDMRKERSVLPYTCVVLVHHTCIFFHVHVLCSVCVHVLLYIYLHMYSTFSLSCCLGNSSAVLILASTLTAMTTFQWRRQG